MRLFGKSTTMLLTTKGTATNYKAYMNKAKALFKYLYTIKTKNADCTAAQFHRLQEQSKFLHLAY